MISKQNALRIPLAALACSTALFLAGCAGMPLTSLYKLSRMDPMEADPAQIKVAVRADEAIGIGKGDAQIEFKFGADDGSLNIDEIYLIEVVGNPALRGEIYIDKKPGESITIMGLTAIDAERMRQLQLAMAPYRNGDVEGSGSLRVNLSGMCLHSKIPPGEVQLDLFLQTSEQEGFFLMAKNLDIGKYWPRKAPIWMSCLVVQVEKTHIQPAQPIYTKNNQTLQHRNGRLVMKVSASIEISKPKEDVWKVITDIENCQGRISSIIAIEVLEEPEAGFVGFKWKETRKMFGKEASEIMWITDSVENEYYSTRAESHGSVYVSRLSLAESAGITTLTMSFSGEAQSLAARILSALMGIFIKSSLKKELQKDLLDIKNYVEQI